MSRLLMHMFFTFKRNILFNKDVGGENSRTWFCLFLTKSFFINRDVVCSRKHEHAFLWIKLGCWFSLCFAVCVWKINSNDVSLILKKVKQLHFY